MYGHIHACVHMFVAISPLLTEFTSLCSLTLPLNPTNSLLKLYSNLQVAIHFLRIQSSEISCGTV